MHIPDNYLSPETCGVMAVVAFPIVALCAKKVREHLPAEKMPMLGVGAAISFLLMMFNVPVPGGTSAHAVGGTLLAALLGPEAACLCVAAALFIQAVFFGDGGILALGANIFNMAIVMPFLGYGLYVVLQKWLPKLVSLAIGAYVGINLAALCAAVEFGVQPALFHTVAGVPLYCPYPLTISLPAMMIPHLTIAGLAEAIFAVGIYSFVGKADSSTLRDAATSVHIRAKRLYGLIIALVVLCPLGLLTSAGAWGEWGADEISDVITGGVPLGFVPSGMANGFDWTPLFADYSVTGLPESMGYILSAIIGIALLVIVFKLFSAGRRQTA